MATVLRVLKDVLGDDFCIDRLEMVCCVDNMAGEDDHEEELDETIQDEGRKHRRYISRSADGEARGPPAMSSQESSSSSRRIQSSSDDSGGTGASGRESSGSGKGAAKDGSPRASPPMPRHFGLFRRVSKSEMEKLLAEEPAAT